MSPNLTTLHKACTDTLAVYIRTIENSCESLSDITKFPISLEKRNVLLAQRRAESAALADYHVARNSLFDAAKWKE